jgi:GrpB-like predicted nucleotidyltransferase (UPF0157 family)
MSIYSKLNRPIIIAEYDPRWLDLYEAERKHLAEILQNRFADIQHIGSTSVPGLAAKPVIDIAIGLRSLDDAGGCIPILEKEGYLYEPELERDMPDRRFLWRVNDKKQRYHLHLAEMQNPVLANPILFRDYLRRHPQTAQRYARLKTELAAKYVTDIGAYVDGKTDFIEEILNLARAEATAP